MTLIELVPRDLTQLKNEAVDLLSKFSILDGVNIPDVARLDIRSYEAAQTLLSEGVFVVPHIRSNDYSISDHIDIIGELVSKGLHSLLIVSGDKIDGRPSFEVTPVQLTEQLKHVFPALTIYGAIDPYRQAIQDELAYCRQKLEAGMHGFFTQPFFDPHLAHMYLDLLRDTTVYLGISPVTTDASKRYWEVRNKVPFPSTFQPTLSYNAKLAHTLINLTKSYSQHTYLMPIKISPQDYLNAISQETVLHR